MDGSSRSEGLPQIYGPPIGDRIIKSLSEKSQIESLSETESHADDIGIETLIRQPVVQNRQEPAPLENRRAENLTGKLVDDLTAAKGENKEKLSKIRSETLIKVAKIAAVAILTTVVVVALTAAAAGCCVVPGGAILVVPLGILAMGAIAGGVMIGTAINSSAPSKFTKEEVQTFEKNKANINEALKLNEKYPQTETSNGRSFEEFMTKKQSEQGRLFQVADLDNYTGLYKQERLKNDKQMVQDDFTDVNKKIGVLTSRIASGDYTETDKNELKDLKEIQKSLKKELNDKNEDYDPEKVAEFKGAIAASNQRAAQIEADARAGGANGAGVVNPQQGGGRDGAGLVNPQGAGRPEGANGPQNARGVVPNPFESVESGEGLDVMPTLQNQINDKKEYLAPWKKLLNKQNEDLKTSENNIIAAKKQLIALGANEEVVKKDLSECTDTNEKGRKLNSDVAKFERLHALQQRTNAEQKEYEELTYDPLIFARILTREEQRSDDIKNFIPQIKREIERTTAEITQLESRKLAEQGVGRAGANPQQNVAREGILFDSEVDGTDSDAASESVESGEGGDIMPSLQDQIKVKNAQVARLNQQLDEETAELNASEILITSTELRLTALDPEEKSSTEKLNNFTEKLNNFMETAENRVKLDSDVDRFDKLRAKTLKTKAEQKEYNALNNNPLIHTEIHRLGQQESTRLNRSIENTKAEIKQLEKQPQIPNQKGFEAKIEQKLSALDSSEDESEFSELTGLLTTPFNKENSPQKPKITTRINETSEGWVESVEDSSEGPAPIIREPINASSTVSTARSSQTPDAIDEELERMVNTASEPAQTPNISSQNEQVGPNVRTSPKPLPRPEKTKTTDASSTTARKYDTLDLIVADLQANPGVPTESKRVAQENKEKITDNNDKISDITSKLKSRENRRANRSAKRRALEVGSSIKHPFNIPEIKSNSEILKTKNIEIEQKLQTDSPVTQKEKQSLIEQKVNNDRTIRTGDELEQAFNEFIAPRRALEKANQTLFVEIENIASGSQIQSSNPEASQAKEPSLAQDPMKQRLALTKEIAESEQKIKSLPDEIVAKGNQLTKLKNNKAPVEDINNLEKTIAASKDELKALKSSVEEKKKLAETLAESSRAQAKAATTNKPLNASSATTEQAPNDLEQSPLSPEQKQRLMDAGIEFKENTLELREAIQQKINSLFDEASDLVRNPRPDLGQEASEALAQTKFNQEDELKSILNTLKTSQKDTKVQEQVSAKAQEEPALVSENAATKNLKTYPNDTETAERLKLGPEYALTSNINADKRTLEDSKTQLGELLGLKRAPSPDDVIDQKMYVAFYLREGFNAGPVDEKIKGLEKTKKDLEVLTKKNLDQIEKNERLISKNDKNPTKANQLIADNNKLRNEIEINGKEQIKTEKLLVDVRNLKLACSTLDQRIKAGTEKMQGLSGAKDNPTSL